MIAWLFDSLPPLVKTTSVGSQQSSAATAQGHLQRLLTVLPDSPYHEAAAFQQIELLRAGADAFRVNMSHGDHATHAQTIAAIRFSIEVKGRKHLAEVIRRTRRLPVVHGVQRM